MGYQNCSVRFVGKNFLIISYLEYSSKQLVLQILQIPDKLPSNAFRLRFLERVVGKGMKLF